MIGIKNSWRMRWPFTLTLALAAFGVVSASMIRRHDASLAAYERISRQFEEPEWPAGIDGNMICPWKDLPDGRCEIERWNGWRSVGPLESGRESGSWETLAPDGSVRARFEMRGGEREGPCEFRDATGLRRVHGAYRRSQRIGLWTLENVLGQGSTYLYFGR
jgi:hypothetical protein